MKITITKDTIILIGLLYNYLTNYELELNERRIQSFLDTVKMKIETENLGLEITDEFIENQTKEVNKYLEKNEELKIYKLINIYSIDLWYKKLPKELINLTLKNNILSTIYSENLRLLVPIKKIYIPYQGTKVIVSSSETEAKEELIKSLTKENNKNFQIESILKSSEENKEEYTITYKYNKCLETIDMEETLAKRIKKKKEVLELLFQKRKNMLNITDEYKEVELAIEKVKKQLYGKINNNQINEQKKDSRPKELIELAGKYAEAFDLKSIDIPDYLIEKLRPLEEITLKKNESFEEQEINKTEKTKKRKRFIF